MAASGKRRMLKAAVLAMLSVGVLSGCVRIGEKSAPERLYTLRPTAVAPAGSLTDVQPETTLAVLEPVTSQQLAVARIPVQITNDSLAYLRDAVWVERPARLFQRLLAETIRANSNRLVISEGDLQYRTRTRLSGRLSEMGYDVATSSAIVRYDAVLQLADGEIRSRRFESTVPGVAAEAATVASALNSAANQVAGEVAAWVAE